MERYTLPLLSFLADINKLSEMAKKFTSLLTLDREGGGGEGKGEGKRRREIGEQEVERRGGIRRKDQHPLWGGGGVEGERYPVVVFAETDYTGKHEWCIIQEDDTNMLLETSQGTATGKGKKKGRSI